MMVGDSLEDAKAFYSNRRWVFFSGYSTKTPARSPHGMAVSVISPEMAIRLEKMGWGTADGWLQLQMNYDLSQARQNADNITVQPIV